jgi:hypothetical protein
MCGQVTRMYLAVFDGIDYDDQEPIWFVILELFLVQF